MSLYSSSRSKSNPCRIFLRSALKLFCLLLHETVPRNEKVTNILWPQLQPTNFLLEILRVLHKYHQTPSFWKNYPTEVRNFKERGSKRYQKTFKKRKILNTSKNYLCLFDPVKNFISLFEMGRNAEFI